MSEDEHVGNDLLMKVEVPIRWSCNDSRVVVLCAVLQYSAALPARWFHGSYVEVDLVTTMGAVTNPTDPSHWDCNVSCNEVFGGL